MNEYEDLYSRRDADDREWEESTGYAEHADPAVFFLVTPISSGASNAAQTTFLCNVANVINDETEGTPLATEYAGRQILATNVTTTRPILNQDLLPCFKVGDRFVILKY